MQSEYWRARKHEEATWVEYGNDVEGSGFSGAGPDCRDPLARTAWNFQVSPEALHVSSPVNAGDLGLAPDSPPCTEWVAASIY